ncbi:hypothetical protein CEP52_006407 [Fusarium oligoseptatum]|uniref:Uncharacterized protein n=1 Tax=Fusarium oligoseptatum TaxID=2604345 RepID=A0A428TT19_9HYPO|nr:hypothetical protein CEP52_006407 [Fusarium oligoseptatum]
MLIGVQNDLRAAFDEQLDKIQARIRQNYLLLSGGLGSSPYIREKLSAFCRHNEDLKETKLVVSDQPTMAVSMGLVYNAISNGKLLAEICCPTSFGLVFRMPNDVSIRSRLKSKWQELKRRGLFPNQDSLATGVDWFIKEGTKKANGDEITQPYTTSFLKEEKTRICEVRIILSSKKDPSPVEKDHTQRRIVMQVDLSHSDPIKEYVTWRNKSCVDSQGRKVSEWVRFPADGGQNMRPLLMGLDESDENVGSERREEDAV